MKNTFLILAIVVTIACKAQTPVKSLFDDEFDYSSSVYYKDTYNDLDKFEGVWVYTNGNTSLTVVLQKEEMLYNNILGNNFYEDLLVGEYQYIENGVEKVNSLSNLQNQNFDKFDHNILGNIIIKPVPTNPDYCYGCGPNDVKVKLQFSDPERDIFGYEPEMIFHHYVENGVEKLRLNFRTISGPATGWNGEENEFDEYNIPFGVYTLVKQ